MRVSSRCGFVSRQATHVRIGTWRRVGCPFVFGTGDLFSCDFSGVGPHYSPDKRKGTPETPWRPFPEGQRGSATFDREILPLSLLQSSQHGFSCPAQCPVIAKGYTTKFMSYAG